MKRQIIIFFALFFVYCSYGVSYIAVQSGDWNAQSTWAVSKTGTITVASGSTTVTGVGTSFNTEFKVGDKLYSSTGVYIGTISVIGSATSLTLASNSPAAYTTESCNGQCVFYNTGTISTNGTTAGTGTGTIFTTEVNVGDMLYTSTGTYLGTVNAIGSAISITFATNATATYSGQFFTGIGITQTGTISYNWATPVTGVGTSFSVFESGLTLYQSNNTYIAVIASITDNLNLTLATIAQGGYFGGAYRVGNVPVKSSEVITIASGVTVSSSSSFTTTNSITVNGTLSFTGNLNVQNNSNITVNNGGTLNISGNLGFNSNSGGGPIFNVNTGGTLTVGGNVTGDNTKPITFNNSGYVEMNGNLSADQMNLTNSTTGVLLVHGNISAAGSNIKIYNSGIVTIDQSSTFGKTNFYNYATGKFFLFGTLTIQTSSTFTNYGLIEVNDFKLDETAGGFINETCSASLTGTISTSNASTTVTGNGTLFTNDIAVGSVITRQSDCFVLGTVTSISDDTHLTLAANASVNSAGINYAISQPGTMIVLNTFTILGNTCPGCSNLNTPGNVYYNALAGFGGAGNCSGSACAAWFSGQSTVQTITPGRRIWLAPDFIGYGLGSDGQLIKRWFDLANTYGFYMSQSTPSYQPTLKNNATDNLNFNPVVSFSSGEKHLDLNTHNLECNPGAGGGISMFAVSVPASGSTGTPAIVDFGLRPTKGYGLAYSAQSAYIYTATTPGGNTNTVAAHGRTTKPTLLSTTTAWSGTQSMFIDGTSASSPSTVTLTQLTSAEINEASPATATNGPFTLGWSSTTANTFDYEGTVGDIIVYANCVSSTIQEATQSFLALKYGITLPHAYRDYVGNIVRAIDAPFANDIAGLAREDMNILHQRKSKSVNTGAELTISTAAIVNSQYSQKSITTDIKANRSYLIWGHNGNAANSGNRVYKITASNFKQQVYLQFAIPLATAPILLIADDAAFTTNVNGIYGNSDGTYLTYNNTFSNNKDQYFKLLIPSGTSTPGVLISETAPLPTIKNTAELQVYSTSKGVLLPALADTSTIAKVGGMMFYNTTHNRFMYYDATATAWKFVGAPLRQTQTVLSSSNGYYTGEIRYNLTSHTLWIWYDSAWHELNHN